MIVRRTKTNVSSSAGSVYLFLTAFLPPHSEDGRRYPLCSNSTHKDIFGSQSGSSPFSLSTRGARTRFRGWFGTGNKSQMLPPASKPQASASFNSEQGRGEQTDVPDVVLDPIQTSSEVVLVI